MKKDFMKLYEAMEEREMNVNIQWDDCNKMTIDRVTRYKRYVKLILIDADGELYYVKCTYREFANLILDGGY